MSQIPPDPEQRQPLNYERVTAGSGDAPAVRIVIICILTATVLLFGIFWFLMGKSPTTVVPVRAVVPRAVPATSAILQPAATQP